MWEAIYFICIILSVDFTMLLIYFFLKRKDKKQNGQDNESICPFIRHAQSDNEFARFIERIGKP